MNMKQGYKSFKLGFNKLLPFSPLFWVVMLWYSVAPITWMVKHPKANEFTILTNIKAVMLFQESELYK